MRDEKLNDSHQLATHITPLTHDITTTDTPHTSDDPDATHISHHSTAEQFFRPAHEPRSALSRCRSRDMLQSNPFPRHVFVIRLIWSAHCRLRDAHLHGTHETASHQAELLDKHAPGGDGVSPRGLIALCESRWTFSCPASAAAASSTSTSSCVAANSTMDIVPERSTP